MPYHCHNSHTLKLETGDDITLANFPFERILKTRKDGDVLYAYIQCNPTPEHADGLVCLGWVPKVDIEYVDAYAVA